MTLTHGSGNDYTAGGHESLHHAHGMYDVPVSNEATEQEVMEMLRNAGEMVHYTSATEPHHRHHHHPHHDPNVLHTQEVVRGNPGRGSSSKSSSSTMGGGGGAAASAGGGLSSKRMAQSPEDWLHQRRQSHKEVERRRRETINSCITELGRLLNLSAGNKSVVLKEAIEFVSKTLNNHYALLEQHRRELDERDQRISMLENELRLIKSTGKIGEHSSSSSSTVETKRMRLE